MTVEITNPAVIPGPAPLSQSEERTWAMLAHLSVLVNLVTGWLGPIVALAIYLAFANRSKYIAYHALQSFLFQLFWWYGLGIVWGITGLLSLMLVGLLLIPAALVLTPVFLVGMVVAPIVGIIGAVRTSQGHDFRYWWVGDWVRGSLD